MAILIDSDVFIELERQRISPIEFLASLPDEPIALAAITAAELLVGVERASTIAQRVQRESFVETVLAVVPVLAYDLRTARVHAVLSGQLATLGQSIGTHDIQIAATATAHGYGVLTHNLRDFQRIPGLVVHRV